MFSLLASLIAFCRLSYSTLVVLFIATLVETEDANIYGVGFNDFYCTSCKIEDIKLDNKEKNNILEVINEKVKYFSRCFIFICI